MSVPTVDNSAVPISEYERLKTLLEQRERELAKANEELDRQSSELEWARNHHEILQVQNNVMAEGLAQIEKAFAYSDNKDVKELRGIAHDIRMNAEKLSNGGKARTRTALGWTPSMYNG